MNENPSSCVTIPGDKSVFTRGRSWPGKGWHSKARRPEEDKG